MITLSNFLIAFCVSYLSTFFLKILALKAGIVDEPDDKRKIHKKPIPLLGGLSIFFGICVVVYLNHFIFAKVWPVFIGATIIFLLNLADDIKGLTARFRFIAELLAALFVVSWGVKVTFLPPGFFGNLGEILLSLIWFVGLSNAFNYLDGMNGLAAGSAVISSFFFLVILFFTSQFEVSTLAVALMGGCLGFLPHNFRKAKIFLGDAGSTFLGFLLAGIGLLGYWAQDNIVKISIPILILGVPIFDMFFTTIIRVKEGKVRNFGEWLKYAGKDHFHHSLVDLGLGKTGAVVFIWFVTFSLGLSAFMVSNDKAWEGVVTLLQASVIFSIIGVLIVIGKKHRSGWRIEK